MNLGDELFELKSKRSKSRIGPVEYYLSLARLIDASPDADPAPYEFTLTSVRRIEALLEDRLAASGRGLNEKIESVANRISPDLKSELHYIAALQQVISRGENLGPVEISCLQSNCAQALVKTVQLAEAASPPDPSIRIKAFLPT